MTQAKSEKKPNKIIKNDGQNEQIPAPEEKSENPNEANEQDIPALAAKKLQEAEEANEFADRESQEEEKTREHEDPGTPEAKDEHNVTTVKEERRKSAAGMLEKLSAINKQDEKRQSAIKLKERLAEVGED